MTIFKSGINSLYLKTDELDLKIKKVINRFKSIKSVAEKTRFEIFYSHFLLIFAT